MREQDKELSVEELETLCNLYIECKLSVLEETELYYVLLKTDKGSVLIDETKTIMGMERKFSEPLRQLSVRKRPFYRRLSFQWVAAGILGILLLISVFFKFGERAAKEVPLLTQNHSDKKLTESVEVRISRPETQSNTKMETEVPVNKANIRLPKQIKHNETHSGLDDRHREDNTGLSGGGDYIEIVDEEEVVMILKDIDFDLTAILEKGIKAQKNVAEINEKINKVLEKI